MSGRRKTRYSLRGGVIERVSDTGSAFAETTPRTAKGSRDRRPGQDREEQRPDRASRDAAIHDRGERAAPLLRVVLPVKAEHAVVEGPDQARRAERAARPVL